jgi:hypothetical protein
MSSIIMEQPFKFGDSHHSQLLKTGKAGAEGKSRAVSWFQDTPCHPRNWFKDA